MAEQLYIFSPQDEENIPMNASSMYLGSSPPSTIPESYSRKPKKPPPITPKRFSRFFTPRSTFTNGSRSRSDGRSARQLRDITQNGANRRKTDHAKSTGRSVLFADIDGIENLRTPKTSLKRKRDGMPTPESSPIQPSPTKRTRAHLSTVQILQDVIEEGVVLEPELPEIYIEEPAPLPIHRAKTRGQGGRLLERSFGGFRAIGRGRTYDHCTDGQSQTANFWSGSEDKHSFNHVVLPFCTASCNTNTLVAFGDEEGGIRLVETVNGESSSFSDSYISLRHHVNAVMDITFSSDDYLLATASGDQTARIIDMKTQQTTHVLAGHTASVKQVRFQPGNDSVLSTCSRDGSIQLWDLRCRGSSSILQEPRASFQSSSFADSEDMVSHRVTYANTYNSIYGAHAERQSVVKTLPGQDIPPKDNLVRSYSSPSRLDVSVTALEFLSSSRSHLLLTASEASTSIRLWDIRGRYSRRGAAVPVSATRQPESHSKHRHFGVNSLAITNDRSRFFALSKDNTVYAYSTSHLVLGHAPELSSTNPRTQRYGGEGKEGLGPIYGFRHPQFHAVSFYVKAAIRPANGDQAELLAVGSADSCPILFPTDESLFRKQSSKGNVNTNDSYARPSLSRTPSGLSARMNDTVPIYEHGTPLIRGHNKEVTSLAWTTKGDLVTASDDYTARVWREGPEARDLRLGGESGGRRWGCAWADVPEEGDN